MKLLSHVRLFVIPWTVAYQAPPSMDFLGQSSRVGCHFLLRGIFSAQGLNPGLPHYMQTVYPRSHQGSHQVSKTVQVTKNHINITQFCFIYISNSRKPIITIALKVPPSSPVHCRYTTQVQFSRTPHLKCSPGPSPAHLLYSFSLPQFSSSEDLPWRKEEGKRWNFSLGTTGMKSSFLTQE